MTNTDGSDFEFTLNNGDTVKAEDVFGTGKEFVIAKTGNGAGFTITSVRAGTAQPGVGGAINNIAFIAADAAEVESTTAKGVNPGSATSSFTFSEGVDYGTAITVDGKTYELVADERDTTNRGNIAVVVDDLSNLNAIASAFAKAIGDNASTHLDDDGNEVADYTAAAKGATVTITTEAKGSDVKAMATTTPYGDQVPTVSFQFDPSKIQEGSYLTVSDGSNTHTYESFVKGILTKAEYLELQERYNGSAPMRDTASLLSRMFPGNWAWVLIFPHA